jgi:hypothetical protein
MPLIVPDLPCKPVSAPRLSYNAAMQPPQFNTRTLFLATTAVAISLWGVLEWSRSMSGPGFGFPNPPGYDEPELLRLAKLYLQPGLIWIPYIFAAYCIGRRSLTVKSVLIFVVIEAIAIWFWRLPI